MPQSQNIISSASDYEYSSTEGAHTDGYLGPPILALCKNLQAKRVFDVACGNGTLCRDLHSAGFEVAGRDPSESGIKFAQEALPGANFTLLGVYDDPQKIGVADYDVVVSTEVVEHLFSPRYLPRFARHLLKPGGHLILSTPYHGYLKNLLLSIFNKWDFHHTPLWDGGHVKFWSKDTLSKMLVEEGFAVTDFVGTGRIRFCGRA